MKKDQSIETLRGIAIILMVAGHVIGDRSSTGMKVADDSLFRYVYFSFQFLRMPLFTVISGFVYAMRPVDPTNTFNFLRGKFRRILLPFVTFATIQFLFRCFVPGINIPAEIKDIWKIYVFTFDQFWFLQSIFLVFLLVSLLEKYRLLSNPKYYFLFFLAASVTYFFHNSVTTFFSFDGFLYLLPFFLLGLGIKRFKFIFDQRLFKIITISLFILGIFVQQLIWFKIIPTPVTYDYFFLAYGVGFSGTLTLFYLRKSQHFLAKLGYYSYGIYLMHVFGTASSRIILMRMGVKGNLFIFIVSLGFGLLLPVLAEFIIMKKRFLKIICLGLKK